MELPAHHNSSHYQHKEEIFIEQREQVTIVDHTGTKIIEGNVSLNHSSAARAAILSRGISVQIMNRIFSKNVRGYISKWKQGVVMQSGGMDRVVAAMKERPDEYRYISRAGAVEAISRIVTAMHNRIKLKTMNQIGF